MPDDAHTPTPRAARPLARLLLGLTLFVGLVAAVPAPVAVADGSSGPPTGEYIPHRVWQMKSNCVWAAGEMLLDKWTHGGVRVRQSVLRRASSDKKGGSSLYDLARGIARVTGIRLRYSPSYGDSMTWWQLLDRLDHGGGAVLIGEYGRLPSHYTRWEPAFARRRNSSHAVYIQSYDRVRGRVWLMDPLADGDFQGEWIAVETLHRFASFQHGKVMAAATPARHRPTAPPLVDHAYRLAGPRLTGTPVAGSTVTVQVGLAIRWGFPTPTPQRLTAHWVPVASTDPPDPPSRSRVVIDSARAPGALPPPDPVETMTASAPTRAGAAGFRTTLPVPVIPGRYRLSLGLAEVGRRTPSRTFPTIELEVVPPFAATISMAPIGEVAAGSAVPTKLVVTNIGTLDWRPTVPAGDDPRPTEPSPQTMLVLTWRSTDGSVVPAGKLPIALAPGQTTRLSPGLVAPPDAGAWTLAVDIAHPDYGALSSTGRDLPSLSVIVDPKGLAAEN